MSKPGYYEYIQSPKWFALRRRIIDERKVCEKCSFPYELNVHHKTYKRLGNEHGDDLIVLCRTCHARHHFVEEFENNPHLYPGSPDDYKRRLETETEVARERSINREHERQDNMTDEDEWEDQNKNE